MVLPFRQIKGTNDYEVDSDNILAFPARIMEEIAISPDEYDERNFSILTNYMLSAYIRLKESEKFKLINNNYIPPDIGHYDGEDFLKIVKNPVGNPSQGLTAGSTPKLPFFLNYIERQINWAFDEIGEPNKFSKLTKVDHTLTSWVPSIKGDLFKGYAGFRDPQTPHDCSGIKPPVQCCFLRITDDFKMDKLELKRNYLSWGRDGRKHIPHFTHCVSGGRSGFSAEIIHPSVSGVDELLGSEKGRHNF